MYVKKILSIVLSVVMVFSMSVTALASDAPQNELILPAIVEYHDPEPYPANLISIESSPRPDGTGIDIYVGNLGIDGLDSVTVSVTATDHPTPLTQTFYVFPLIGHTFRFDIPMTKCDMKYYITAVVTDGGQTQHFSRTAGLVYSEESLALMDWGKGTYATRQISVNKHFERHHDNVGVKVSNIVDYLDLAIDTFNDTYNNPQNYKVVQQDPKPGFAAAHKYTNKTNYRFIIYGDETGTIYTFGGK